MRATVKLKLGLTFATVILLSMLTYGIHTFCLGNLFQQNQHIIPVLRNNGAHVQTSKRGFNASNP